jgi:hypothetical protein
MIGAGSFASIESLRNAYIDLDDKGFAPFASRKMWIRPTTHIKYNIPLDIAKAVSRNIDTIAAECNQVKCEMCQMNLCWACLTVFPSNEVGYFAW